jgi:hypothetical protein
MDPITQQTILAAAGAAGGEKVYVDDVFSTFLYTGTGSARSINNGIDLAGEGGLVWIKDRDNSNDHALYDSERNLSYGLRTNSSSNLSADATQVTSLNNNGFSLGTGYNLFATNQNNADYVSWTFRKAPGFFDVVTYTGTGSARTVAHSLGSVPGMILVKRTDTTENWHVYHRSTGATKYLILDATNAEATGSSVWNDTTPTSTNFTVGTNGAVNGSGGTYVAYVFAHDDAQFGTDEDESIIKCGSYTGSGSPNKHIELGFEPQFVMFKNTTNSSDWFMMDIMRGFTVDGVADNYIFANKTDAEDVSPFINPTQTGFNFSSTGAGSNESGSTYIYMAIRRPNKPPEAATEVFAIDTGSGSSIPNWDSGFPVDASWTKSVTAAGDPGFFTSRLIGSRGGYTHYANAEHADSGVEWDSNVGWGKNYGSGYISFMFKRAPGFFDVVAYTGTGSAQNVTHNLDAVPELIIVKARDVVDHWQVYSSVTDETDFLMLNQTDATSDQASKWNDTAPTSSVFTVNTDTGVNQSTKAYVAYLFATLPGISKVGTYTGTGSANNIDCGFTAGARFVLIKRTDASGDWFVFDTARGIVSGNDFFLKLNSTSAQAGGDDYIDPYAAGFTINGTYSGLNASGGTYIFLAIA